MARAVVTGIQSQGVEVTAKHLCGQGETTGGVNASAARIGQRELREIHLPPVKACVEAGVTSFMAAYNEIDGIYCHANPALLTDLLREEMGFQGVIVTDDGIHLDSKFAKEHLKYDELKENGKVNEITIDSTWSLNNEVEGEVHALWERLVDEAGKVKQGLLVINVRDINLFKHCWDLKQLVKQEKLDFGGYVLLVLKDMDWEKEVRKFVHKPEDENSTEFKVMMENFYRLI